MELLIDFGPDISRWLQENFPQLQSFMALITELGRFNFYLVVIPLIYWSINKQLGVHLIYLLTLSNTIGETLKQAFRDPRPFWYDPAIGLADELTYGFPSNHSLVPPIMIFVIASWLRKGWFWVLGVILIILIMLSRVYLGVHDVPDVIFGFLIGMIILGCYLIWRKYFLKRFNNRILGQKLLAAVLICLLFTIIFILILLIIGDPVIENPDWAHYYAESERAGLDGAAANISSLLAFGIGLLLESTRIRFDSGGTAAKRALRYLTGIVTTLIIFFGLRSIFPDTDEAAYIISLPLRALRYFITSLWVSYYAPALFIRLNLAERQTEPNGITIKD